MPSEAMFAFIEKCANNEMFRSDLIANPAEVLANAGLEEEDLRSIKQDEAWAWLRALWNAPRRLVAHPRCPREWRPLHQVGRRMEGRAKISSTRTAASPAGPSVRPACSAWS